MTGREAGPGQSPQAGRPASNSDACNGRDERT